MVATPALYKVGTGEDISKAPAPGMFDLKVRSCPPPAPPHEQFYPASSSANRRCAHEKQGKAKKAAWQKVVDEGLSPEEAQAKYVTLVEGMKETYGYDESKEPEAVGA